MEVTQLSALPGSDRFVMGEVYMSVLKKFGFSGPIFLSVAILWLCVVLTEEVLCSPNW